MLRLPASLQATDVDRRLQRKHQVGAEVGSVQGLPVMTSAVRISTLRTHLIDEIREHTSAISVKARAARCVPTAHFQEA
jgi:hypothetical protein